jgi:hypothetical protein
MTSNHDQAAGAATGALLGFIKSLTLITTLTWLTVFETGVLALVGASVGFLGTTILKYLIKKIFG